METKPPTKKPCTVCTDFQVLRKKTLKDSKLAVDATTVECPPDAGALGRGTWTFLHTMAAYYPEEASAKEQQAMRGLIEGLSLFYPCGECALHLQHEMKSDPPKLKSNKELSDWFCQMHNKVNARQGKPTFDCSKVFERWRDGPKTQNHCFE
ncbi:hypothetical protein HDV03_004585 [Kappamyces sp. JEL0829]|nr:hypothetical protein HDV03_004585 [Kappamyces sp. JEL0829]